MGRAPLIGYLMICFSLGISVMLFDMWLAEIARRTWGNFTKWFLGFLLLPLLSHVYFVIKLQSFNRMVQRGRDERLEERRRERELNKTSGKAHIPITPFDSADETDDKVIITVPGYSSPINSGIRRLKN